MFVKILQYFLLKIKNFNNKIVNTNYRYVTVSSVMAMIVGFGVIIAGFVALFMYIRTKAPPEKSGKGGNGPPPAKNNLPSPPAQSADQTPGKDDIMKKLMEGMMPGKGGEQDNNKPAKLENNGKDDGNPISAFQDLMSKMPKTTDGSNKNNNGSVMPTINKDQTNGDGNNTPPENKDMSSLFNKPNKDIAKDIPKQNLDTINNVKTQSKNNLLS